MNVATNEEAGQALLEELRERFPENDFILITSNKERIDGKYPVGHLSTLEPQEQLILFMQASINMGEAMGFPQPGLDEMLKPEPEITIKKHVLTTGEIKFDADKVMAAILKECPGFGISLCIYDPESEKGGNFSNMAPEDNLEFLKYHVGGIETYLAETSGEPN